MSTSANREALLAAINEAAGGLNKKVDERRHSELITGSKVNPAMQRDLVSNASRAADLNDFNDGTKVSFEVGVKSLAQKGLELNQK